MLLGNFIQKSAPIEPVRLQEKIKYEINIHKNGYHENAKLIKNLTTANYQDKYIATISLKRDLRTNNIMIFLENKVDFNGAFFVNHKYWPISSLSNYRTAAGFYKLSPENILTGDFGHMEKLNQFGVAIDEHNGRDNHKLEINLKAHTNLANSEIIDTGGGVILSTITTNNFVIMKNEESGKYKVYESDLYDFLVLKPKPILSRTIKDIYDVYEAFNTNPIMVGTDYGDIAESVQQPSFGGLNIDYHDGKYQGLYEDNKTTLKTSFTTTSSEKVEKIALKDNENKTNFYAKKGTISLKGYSHYDYAKKMTKIGVGPFAKRGYTFPYSKRGQLHSELTLSPNRALQNIHIYREYNFDRVILGKQNGSIKLMIGNPEEVIGTPTTEFTFNEKQQQRIMLSDMSLLEMSSL